MSKWTHSICLKCWTGINLNRRPVAVNDAEKEICCYCGDETRSGIYVRVDPKSLECVHAPTEDTE